MFRAADAGRAERFALGSVIGFAVVVLLGGGFVVLVALVSTQWAPLRAVDLAVVEGLNDVVAGRPTLAWVLTRLSHLGGSLASWLVMTLLTVWLLIRRLPRLAVYVAVTGLGAAVLDPTVKLLVGRARPMVEQTVATAPGHSFPSGHTLGSTVTYGTLLLVFLPVVPRRARRLVTLGAVGVVTAVALTRIALGVHYLTDVLAGAILGLAWLGVTGLAFMCWRGQDGLPRSAPVQGLAPEAAGSLKPAPDAWAEVLPHAGRTTAALLVAWVLLFGLLLGAGLLITGVLADTAVGAWNSAVVSWLASARTPTLTALADIASRLGSTGLVIAVAGAAAALSLALTRRWPPLIFLVAVMGGEVTLFLTVAQVIGRSRPDVPHLGPQIPPTSSFPSGHVAAALALYGAIGLLVAAWTTRRRRWLAIGWACLAPVLVAAARLYRGVHFPTDVLGSVLLAGPWLLACWTLLQPRPTPRGGPSGGRRSEATPAEARQLTGSSPDGPHHP